MDRSDNYLASGTTEGRYRFLVESISDYAIYLLDPDGTVVNWNQGAQRFKGYQTSIEANSNVWASRSVNAIFRPLSRQLRRLSLGLAFRVGSARWD